MEVLEDRTVLTSGVQLSKGILSITGTSSTSSTSGKDIALVQQIPPSGNQAAQIAVTLNGRTSTFKAASVNEIRAQLDTGDDTITLDSINVATVTVDGGAGTDSFAGKFAGDFTGNLTLSGFENATMQVGNNFDGTLTVNTPGLLQQLAVTGTVTATSTITATNVSNVSIGTLAGRLTAAGGSIVDATVTSIASTGLLEATEVPAGPAAGLVSNTTFGTISGRVFAGSIVGMKVSNVTAGAAIRAAGQGTTSNVSIGTLSGSFTAPEDQKSGSGVMSNTTISSITSTGTVSTGSISGMSVGTNAGSITAAGQGTTSNVSIGTLSGSFTAPEDQKSGSGVMSNTTINTITSTGTVSTGSISGMSVGTNAGSITAAGQGTTSNVSIGTLSGSFTAPEDSTTGSGTMSNTTISSITSTGTVSTGSISGMSVGTNAGSITAAGQGTTSNVSIGTLSGSFTAPEDSTAGSGVMSNTTISSITSTGTVSTGSISGMSVGTNAGSITAAGQGTTSNVSIGTLSGSFTAPEDSTAGSGTMSNTTISSITSTGTVSTGTISGMSVGTNAGSITAAGQGITSNVSIGTLSGLFTAPVDQNSGSGVMSNTTIDSITSLGTVSTGVIDGMSVGTIQGGTIAATGAVNNLHIGTLQGGNFSAGEFQIVTAQQVIAEEVKLVEPAVTRTLKLSAVPDFSRPASYGFYYDGNGGGNAQVTARIDAGGVSNARGDFSLLTDTVGIAGSGIDLAALYGVGKAFLRNVVVGGNLTPSAANPAFFGLPSSTPGGVQLPQDSVAVAVAGNIPPRSIVVQSAPAVAFGFANGVAAANAKTTDVTGLFASGTPTVQANDTFGVFVGDGTPVALFLVTGANGSNFDAKNVLFADQGADFRPVTAAVRVAAAGSAATIQQIDLTGEYASFQTQQLVSQAITVVSGSLGDVTLGASGGSPANITAPRIVGNIDVTNGAISGTIQTTAGDLGRAFTDATGKITGVTFIRAGAGGLTSTGQILSAANLVSLIDLQSSLDGVVAAQGDIGVIQTDANGNAVVGPSPANALTRFGGINVSTGGVKGFIIALGNVFGDINISGGLDGRIAVKGRAVMGIDASRTGILGNVSIGGGISDTGAIVSAGRIGDDGISGLTSITDDSVGTKLNISGAAKGILAAEGDINFGSTGNLTQAHIFENVGPGDSSTTPSNANVINWIFTNWGVALTIPDGLRLVDPLGNPVGILDDLAALTLGLDGNLTGTHR